MKCSSKNGGVQTSQSQLLPADLNNIEDEVSESIKEKKKKTIEKIEAFESMRSVKIP